MQDRKGFSELIREGYGSQLPLPLPPAPGVRVRTTETCPRCQLVHADAVDDIACTHGYQHLHPT